VVAAGGTIAASTSAFRPVAPADYREALVTTHRPLSLDPLFGREDAAVRDVGHLLYASLLRLGGDGRPVADLAATWSVSPDGHTYAFTLPAGRRWSDGSAITARDVAATVSVVQSPDFPDGQLAEAWRDVAVGVDSPMSVTMRLRRPRGSFAVVVADLPILPTRAISQPVAELARTATRPLPTSGAYRVVESDSSAVRLAGNPHAVRAPPLASAELRLLPSFEEALRMFAAGQADVLLTTTAGQRAEAAMVPGVRIHDMIGFSTVQLLFNTASLPSGLDQPAVRHAIAAAIDRRGLVAADLPGAAMPQSDPVPLGVRWVPHPAVPSPDAALAGKTLDAAGWTADTPGAVRTRESARLVERLMVSDEEPLPAVAHELVRQLRPLGIEVEIDQVAPARFYGMLTAATKEYDMALADVESGPDPDVSAQWRSDETPPKGVNVTGLKPDFVFDRALDRLAQESDPKLRRAAAEEVGRDLAASAPAVFLYAPLVSVATSDALDIPLPVAGSSAQRYELVDGWRRLHR
jgi:peptide/nickel transport system substrate-binding protein